MKSRFKLNEISWRNMISKTWKAILVGLIICLSWSHAFPFNNQDALEAWESFVQTYERNYTSDEEYQKRKEQFIENYEIYELHNSGVGWSGSSYQLGVNNFSDLSTEEFLSAYTGAVVPENITITNNTDQPPLNVSRVGYTYNFDWRLVPNSLTRIKSQGSCGSCWAFASIATMEAVYNYRKGYLSDFSEQFLVDCDTSDSGCNGGSPGTALAYLKSKGAAYESSYPYKATKGSCKSSLASTSFTKFYVYTLKNYGDSTLQSTVYNYGPVAVGIDATPLKSYKSGILNTKSCSSINHIVNVVGYVTSGSGAPYYILRNSWGTSWGESGYFRLSAANSCLIKNYGWYIAYY